MQSTGFRKGVWKPRRRGVTLRHCAVALGLVACGASAAGAEPGAGAAQAEVRLASSVESIVVTADSPDTRVKLESGEGAEQLVFNVTFSNVGDGIVDTVRITVPIPSEVAYVAGSASGPGSDVLFSVDRGLTFARPNELVAAAQAAASADYTHIRWVFHAPLDGGATGVVRFAAARRATP